MVATHGTGWQTSVAGEITANMQAGLEHANQSQQLSNLAQLLSASK